MESAVTVLHQVQASSLAGYPALTRELGGDPVRLWREAGLDAAALADLREDLYLPHAQVEALLERTARELETPHFALLLGQRLSLSMLGLIGFVMQQSPTVGAALSELQRHFHMLARGSALELATEGEDLLLNFVVHDSRALPGVRCTAELCLSAGQQVMRSLLGVDWCPREVAFAHAAPADALPYRRWFAAPVRFDAEQNSLRFPATLLAQPISNADPQLGRVLNTYLELLDAQFSDDPVARIRQLIRRALATGSCSADKVARFLGMHRRTLHRMLRAHGTSFSQLLEEVRRDMAERALGDSQMPVTQVAQMLCYAETSAFTRAFGRWYGMSPREWRQRRRAKPSEPSAAISSHTPAGSGTAANLSSNS